MDGYDSEKMDVRRVRFHGEELWRVKLEGLDALAPLADFKPDGTPLVDAITAALRTKAIVISGSVFSRHERIGSAKDIVEAGDDPNHDA